MYNKCCKMVYLNHRVLYTYFPSVYLHASNILAALYCKRKTNMLQMDPYCRHGASKCGKCKYVFKYSCASIENMHTVYKACVIFHTVRDVAFVPVIIIPCSCTMFRCYSINRNQATREVYSISE